MAPLYRWLTGGDGSRALSFPFLEHRGGVRALFTSRHRGVSRLVPGTLNLVASVGDDPEAVAENRRRALALIGSRPEQAVIAGLVHGREVVPVTDPGRLPRVEPGGPALLSGVDGLITTVPDLTLVITAADCTPVYLYDPVVRAVGLVHAGWRGTAAGIARAAVAALQEAFGSRPQNLWALVGPSIGPCCYEVDEPVQTAFREQPGAPHWFRPGRRPGRWQLDLWTANRDQLAQAGVPAAQIAVAEICTACHTEDFFSHRAEGGKTGRQAALMRLTQAGAMTTGPGGGADRAR